VQVGEIAAGDYVLSARPDLRPVGRVDVVLEAASGTRLVIARAYARGSFVVAAAVELAGSEVSSETGLRWHVLGVPVESLEARGIYRREMGRLTRDPFPTVFGAPRDDAEAAGEVRRALAEDALTRDGEITVRVRHGVAVLEGNLGTVGGKVAAERLARTTPGIWDVVNRLSSDEELGAAVRGRLRFEERVAEGVRDVVARGGVVEVTLLPGFGHLADDVRRLCADVPGLRRLDCLEGEG
jgi:hypothetical protein